MSRPKCQRRVSDFPSYSYFKPQGKPMGRLKEVILTIDELEAIRLADLEGLYQESAAQQMEISRQTFGRIIVSAHHKIAEALIDGKAIKIEGGEFQMADTRKFECLDCGHSWEAPFGTGRPQECPSCKSRNIGRTLPNHRRGMGGRPLGRRHGMGIHQGRGRGRNNR